MKFGKEIERGWTHNFGVVEVQSTAVGNVVSNWDVIIDGQDLFSSDDSLLITEKNPDFYVERLVVHYTPYAIPTAVNTAEFVDAAFGLAILDTQVANREAVPAQFGSDTMWNTDLRAQDEYIRMLTLRFHRTIVRGLPSVSGELPDYNPILQTYFEFDVKNIFLRPNESIVAWCSQTGIDDLFFPWSTSDIAGLSWMSQALVRKKKGR